jgi:hypothetical protein
VVLSGEQFDSIKQEEQKMTARISSVILRLVVLMGYPSVNSQRTERFNGFALVDKTGNIRKPG